MHNDVFKTCNVMTNKFLSSSDPCNCMKKLQLFLSTIVTLLHSGTFKELIALFCDKRHEVVIKELCLGAITLLLRDTAVINMCYETPTVSIGRVRAVLRVLEMLRVL